MTLAQGGLPNGQDSTKVVLALVEPATREVDLPEALEAIRGQGMFLANVPDRCQGFGIEVVGLGVP